MSDMKVPVGVSARHIHLQAEHVEALFGSGHTLTHFKDLSQPGQYACVEQVKIVSEAGKEIANVRILGPVRPQTQVEISRSDAIKLKMEVPVRSSGNLVGTPGITIVGPAGQVKIDSGVMIADRHIHMHTSDAQRMELNDRQIVSVLVAGEKGGIMHNVLVRAHKDFGLDFHIDTDDACAFGLTNGSIVEIIK